MTWSDSLLTDEASPAERAVERASAERYPLGWEVLRTLQSADRIPEDKLPILAWAMSVDIWDHAWPVERKRSVVRQAIADHMLKGTVAGIRRYLDLVDTSLVQYLTPPQRLFLGPSLSKDELEEWLSTMPQLRIRHRSQPIVDLDRALAFFDDAFVDDDFMNVDRGRSIYGRKPFLFDGGVEIPLETVEIVTRSETRTARDVERLGIPGVIGQSAFDHDAYGFAFFDDTVLAPEIVTYQIEAGYLHETSEIAVNTVLPSLQATTIRATTTSDVIDAGPAFFASDFLDDAIFYSPDLGAFAIFDRFYLHDRERAAPMMEATSFYDFDRFGMPPFTIELMVDADETQGIEKGFEGDFLDSMYLLPTDTKRIDAALSAIDLAKGYRDKALVTFETSRARTWGDGLPLDGSVKFGDRVPATL